MAVTGRRVLIFGDSLSHRGATTAPPVVEVREGTNRSSSPGDLLASHLLERGAVAARLDAKVSRSAHNFFRIEPYASLLEADTAWLSADRANPGIVIVMLGTNDLGLGATANQAAFTRLRDAFQRVGAEIWAVGPPAFANAKLQGQTDAVVQVLRNVFGADRVVDSRPLTSDLTTTAAGRAGDGIHFASVGAKTWAARLADVLTRRTGQALTPPSTGLPTKPADGSGDSFGPLLTGLGVGAALAVGLILLRLRRRRTSR